MNKLLHIAERISQYAAWASGTVLLLTCFMIAIEVTLRKGFSISMGGADEISNYALAMSCSWAFAFTLFRKAHIRIDVLYTRMGIAVRFALDIISLVLFALFMTIVSYYAGIVLYTSIARQSVANTPLATPLWIPQGLWLNRSPAPLKMQSWPTGRITRRRPSPPRYLPGPPESSTKE